MARLLSDEGGPVTVETYPVTHVRDGEPQRFSAIVRHDDGRREWCDSTDTAVAAQAEVEELIDQRPRA